MADSYLLVLTHGEPLRNEGSFHTSERTCESLGPPQQPLSTAAREQSRADALTIRTLTAEAHVRGHAGNTWAEPCGRDMKVDAPERGGSSDFPEPAEVAHPFLPRTSRFPRWEDTAEPVPCKATGPAHPMSCPTSSGSQGGRLGEREGTDRKRLTGAMDFTPWRGPQRKGQTHCWTGRRSGARATGGSEAGGEPRGALRSWERVTAHSQ